ncbi:hypothetical protein K432DRAFT_451216 [Lepidopterella palustris CBS 459.81]|uniref:Heterokaryon incompatibility domain-containing protein n=1 Tax=Lepidopterella palustris CBS 459.81 TaxID=1314670 RepID=A0A8E2JFX3_9PEZI|nr:hypothetical protein K432DRAFT_451216 [Lepidopterella palustris CBS 459.81]
MVYLISFWNDTLRVLNGCKHEKLNKQALSKMKQIYVKADKVLVLDSEATACDESTSAFELLARIRLSNWLRRLWTLQEGLFAQSLLFLVGDVAVSLANILRDTADNKQHPPPLNDISARMWQCLKERFHTLLHRSSDLDTETQGSYTFDSKAIEGSINHILRAMSSRTSKFLEDEAGCLAFLLNIDIGPILNAPKAEGMMELFNTLDTRGKELEPPGCIPPGYMVLPEKRINIKGFRWAPGSLLAGPDRQRPLTSHPFKVPAEYPSSELMTRPSGTLCKYGLKIMFPGLRLKNIRENGRMNEFFIIDTPKGDDSDKIGSVPGRPPYTWRAIYSQDAYDKPWEQMAPTMADSGNIAIIIFSYSRSWHTALEGILVKVLHGLDGGSLAVSRLCRMIISETPEYGDHSWVREPSKRVDGDWLPVHQIWCVD